MPLYYGAGVAAAAILHVMVASFYFGSHLLGEIVVLPSMKRAKTNGELAPLQSLFKRLGPVFAGLGMGALVTGLIYLFAKFGLDFEFLLAFPESRTIIAALGIFVGLILVATLLHRPLAEWITEQPLSPNDSTEISPEMRAHIERFAKISHVTTLGVLLVVGLMVTAANGGI